MKIVSTHNQNSQRLILIFTGWATTPALFSDVRFPGYDTAIAYDYRNLTPDQNSLDINNYSEICLIGWSYGVIAATHFMTANRSLPFTARIAVNGTLSPIDDRCGIPKQIFHATADNLSDASLCKFLRRTCGSASRFKELSERLPHRPIEQLRQELLAIEQLNQLPECRDLWDIVFTADNDLIIPTSNQLNAWKGHRDHRTIARCPHLPDIRSIIHNTLINKPLVAKRFNQSAKSYEQNANAQRLICDTLATKITASEIHPNNILEIGCGTGMLTHHLNTSYPDSQLTLWDIAPIDPSLPGFHQTCDAETAIRHTADSSIDLIASASTIQWFNSQIEFIKQCHRSLNHNGLLAISTFGPENFQELAPFLENPLRYHSRSQWQQILGDNGFESIDIDTRNITLQFDSPRDIIDHIRLTGVNATHTSLAATKRLIASHISQLTYNPILIICRKQRQQSKTGSQSA